jgi:hypothetical protein
MLAGQPPFTTESFTALAAAHQHAPVPSLAEQRPGLPTALVTTAEVALAKAPEDRFADARAMRRSLAGAPLGDPAAATTVAATPVTQTAVLPESPPTPPETAPRTARARRPRRLWPALVAGALIGSALLAVLLLATSGGDDPVRAAATSTTAVEVIAPPTTLAPTTPTTRPPQSVEDLIALLALDPSAFGEKGDELLARLERILERPDHAARDAARTIDEIQHWVEDGELSPLLGAQATTILSPLAASDDGKGRGNGNKDFGDD